MATFRAVILLQGHVDEFSIASVTNGDRLRGEINLTAPGGAQVDNIEIVLRGTSKVLIDKFLPSRGSTLPRAESIEHFLWIKQIPEAGSNVTLTEAAPTASIPFDFIVPDKIPPGRCEHPLTSTEILHQHVRLPPSMADCTVSGDGVSLFDDLATEHSRVGYYIVLRCDVTDPATQVAHFVDKCRRLRMVPAYPEKSLPTAESSQWKEDAYETHQQLVLRSKPAPISPVSRKLGELSVRAMPYKAIVLPVTAATPNRVGPTPTHIKLRLRFEDSSAKLNTAPPSPLLIESLTGTLYVNTFFSTAPYSDFPNRFETSFKVNQSVHTEQVALFSRGARHLIWKPVEHEQGESQLVEWDVSATLLRTNPSNGCSNRASTDNPNGSQVLPVVNSSNAASTTGEMSDHLASTILRKDSISWQADFLVPVSLPPTIGWISSFYACHLARTYALDLELALDKKISGGPLRLRLPLNVIVAPRPETGTYGVNGRGGVDGVPFRGHHDRNDMFYNEEDQRNPPPAYSD